MNKKYIIRLRIRSLYGRTAGTIAEGDTCTDPRHPPARQAR